MPSSVKEDNEDNFLRKDKRISRGTNFLTLTIVVVQRMMGLNLAKPFNDN